MPPPAQPSAQPSPPHLLELLRSESFEQRQALRRVPRRGAHGAQQRHHARRGGHEPRSQAAGRHAQRAGPGVQRDGGGLRRLHPWREGRQARQVAGRQWHATQQTVRRMLVGHRSRAEMQRSLRLALRLSTGHDSCVIIERHPSILLWDGNTEQAAACGRHKDGTHSRLTLAAAAGLPETATTAPTARQPAAPHETRLSLPAPT